MRLDAVLSGREVLRDATALRSAMALVPAILELAPDIKRCVEIGAAPCLTAQTLERLGREVTCITSPRERADPAHMFWCARHLALDFERPFPSQQRFDLCVALTAAGSVSTNQAPYLVANLARLSNLIVFSCAPPDGSARTSWLSEWVRMFAAEGLQCVDALRFPLWDNPSVDPFLLESLCIFAPADRFADTRLQRAPLDLVHPRAFELDATRAANSALEHRAMDNAALEAQLSIALEQERRNAAEAWEQHNVIYEGYLQKERALAEAAEQLECARTAADRDKQGAAALQTKAETLQVEVEALQTEAEALKHELRALRASTSWRVTAPLRGLGRLLGRG